MAKKVFELDQRLQKIERIRTTAEKLSEEYLPLESFTFINPYTGPTPLERDALLVDTAARIIHCVWKGFITRKKVKLFVRRKRSATKLQSLWRGVRVRRAQILESRRTAHLQVRVGDLERTLRTTRDRERILEDAMRLLWGEVKSLRMRDDSFYKQLQNTRLTDETYKTTTGSITQVSQGEQSALQVDPAKITQKPSKLQTTRPPQLQTAKPPQLQTALDHFSSSSTTPTLSYQSGLSTRSNSFAKALGDKPEVSTPREIPLVDLVGSPYTVTSHVPTKFNSGDISSPKSKPPEPSPATQPPEDSPATQPPEDSPATQPPEDSPATQPPEDSPATQPPEHSQVTDELRNLSKLFVEVIQAADLGAGIQDGTRVCLQFQGCDGSTQFEVSTRGFPCWNTKFTFDVEEEMEEDTSLTLTLEDEGGSILGTVSIPVGDLPHSVSETSEWYKVHKGEQSAGNEEMLDFGELELSLLWLRSLHTLPPSEIALLDQLNYSKLSVCVRSVGLYAHVGGTNARGKACVGLEFQGSTAQTVWLHESENEIMFDMEFTFDVDSSKDPDMKLSFVRHVKAKGDQDCDQDSSGNEDIPKSQQIVIAMCHLDVETLKDQVRRTQSIEWRPTHNIENGVGEVCLELLWL
eukprot:883633_1